MEQEGEVVEVDKDGKMEERSATYLHWSSPLWMPLLHVLIEVCGKIREPGIFSKKYDSK